MEDFDPKSGSPVPAGSDSVPAPDPEAPTPDPAAPKPDTDDAAPSTTPALPKTPRARFCRPRKPTRRQSLWCEHYTNPDCPGFCNQTKAAELAGYAGRPGSSQLAVQGHRNANNPTIRRALEEVLDDAGCTLELGAQRLRQGMDAQRRKSFLAKNGEIVYSNPEPDYAERRHATELVLRLRGEPGPRGQPTPSATAGLEGPDGYGAITIDGELKVKNVHGGEVPTSKKLSAETQQLIERATKMDQGDRMLGLQIFGLAEGIAKLEGKLERARRQEQGAPPPEGEAKP